ncbi:MAG: hypothetical protein IT581_05875 [Verrucomicrobiales bacterium]|nr:hypothetical protein [Verrucomicrobiales bacterium]
MTAVVVDRREIHLSLWNLALFLPVLPWLGLAHPVENMDPGARVGSVLALSFLGLLIGLGGPCLIERASRALRKEADPMRAPTLTALFVVQAPLLASGGEGFPFSLILFVLCAALLAAIPFGLEFQHGTMGGLLAQPIDRGQTWRRKMGILGAALASLALVLILSLTARTGRIELELGLWLFAVALGAWGTTTAWTLWTRGTLPGLIFSLATPLSAILALGLALDLNLPGPDELWPWAIAYGLVGFALGKRSWNRLEATDSAGNGRSGVFLPSMGLAPTRSRNLASPLLSTLGKELRLQTVTVIALGFAVGFAAARPWLQNWEWAFAVSILFAYTTVLLAATTMVAEERRLGMLDHLLVLPSARRLQWRIKIGVAAALAVIAMGSLLFPQVTNGGAGVGESRAPLSELLNVALSGLAFFAIGTLASTTSRTTLTALIHTLAVFVVAFWMVMAGGTLGPTSARENAQTNAYDDHESFRQRAATLSDADLSRLRSKLDLMDPLQSGRARWVLVLPAVLGAMAALWMARRNFLNSQSGPDRWRRQALVSLGLVGALTFTGAAVDTMVAGAYAETAWLVRASEIQRWFTQLSAGQQELWQRHRADPYSEEIAVRVFDPRPEVRKNVNLMMNLPLNRAMRRVVVEQGRIAESLRALLRKEAADDGDVITLSPPPEPVPEPFDDPMRERRRLNPMPSPDVPIRMMKRYGLVPSIGATNRPSSDKSEKAP